MPRRRSPYGPAYRRARRILLAGNPSCAHCGAPATEADHQPPLSRHEHRDGSGCCVLVPSCGPCQRHQALELSLGLDLPPAPEPDVPPEPDGFPADDPVWNVWWLAELRDVPENATWPRLMTVPHPDAVGSLGGEFIAWAEERSGGRLRWWQRLVAWRLLEIDADGRLVWDAAILSMARQLGKSWLLRELLLWRIHQSERFGEEQLVVHTGKDVAICREVQRPARIWARGRPDIYTVREVNGQEEVTYGGDGRQSRWMIRAKHAVYGLAATMVGVDEGWKVKAEAIEEGVVPAMVEGEQALLLLISTAHRAATTLMLRRRADAITALGTGRGDLLIEWSARADAELGDRAGWRAASPHWTVRREQLIEKRVTAALAGELDLADPDEPDPVEQVRAQWLNVWPQRITRPEKGEPLVDRDVWTAAGVDDDSVGPLVIAVADFHGRGVAVAFCGACSDGFAAPVVPAAPADRLKSNLASGLSRQLPQMAAPMMQLGDLELAQTCRIIGGQLERSRADAWALAARAATARPGSVLVTSAGLADDPAALELPVDQIVKVTAADTGAGLALLRDQLQTGGVVHDRSPALDQQIGQARVTEGARLALIPAAGRHDLVLAAVWALRIAVTRPTPAPAIY